MADGSGAPFHPLANIFPLMEGEEFQALVDDIAAHGQREPIVEYQGQIFDGRNRYLASLQLGLKPWVESFVGDDPLAYVISLNVKRRHLDESQRAMLAAKLAAMRQGARTDLAQICAMSQDHAADLLNVSRRLVQHAVAVRDNAIDELRYAVDQGEISVSHACMLAHNHDPETQRAVVDEVISGGEKAASALRRVQRQADERRVLSLERVIGRFRTLVIDPPWRYDSDFIGRGQPTYATMTQEQLLELPVADWAEDNCHLYLCATNAMLPRAFELMAHWGFAYNNLLTWKKPHYGLGSNFRGQTEHVLFGIRGQLATRRDDVSNFFEASVGEHSEKPEKLYEIVRAQSYPPYGEAFQRTPRPDFVNLFPQSEAA
jgi:N6-adenosine-specific RNA methylase IME4